MWQNTIASGKYDHDVIDIITNDMSDKFNFKHEGNLFPPNPTNCNLTKKWGGNVTIVTEKEIVGHNLLVS